MAHISTSIDGAIASIRQWIDSNNIDHAMLVCRQILSQRPDALAASRLLAEAHSKISQFKEAAEILRGIVDANGNSTAVTLQDALDLGVALRRSGAVAEAEKIFQNLSDISPRNLEFSAQLSATVISGKSNIKDQEYQVIVERYRRSLFMKYPRHVQVETMAVCNASCFFCPYPKMERQGDKMSDELFYKIINDLEKIPKNIQFELELSKVNEPFIDKRIFDFYAAVNSRLPNARLFITTNGSPLTDRVLDRLADVRNIGVMYVSMNDHRPEHYQAAMGLPFDRTYEALRRLHDRLESGQFNFPVALSRVGDGTQADFDFIEWARAKFPRFGQLCYSRFDWLRQVDVPTASQVPQTGCKRWFDLSIMASGKVALCCIDGEGRHQIGDVNQQSVLDVYNAPDYRRLREEATTRAGGEPCESCTYY